MKTSIIYASFTGTTHGIAEEIQNQCGGDLIEVTSRDLLSRFVAFMARHSPGMKVRDSGIAPEKIDLSGSDLLVIGTPVWGESPSRPSGKRLPGSTGAKKNRSLSLLPAEKNRVRPSRSLHRHCRQKV